MSAHSQAFYKLATPTWDGQEEAAMKALIDSGMTTMGENVLAFEQAFADWLGSKYCVMVNSGSSANLLMMGALFFRKNGPTLKAGDEVIVPAVSWSTTFFPVTQYGLKLVFVDVDDSLNMDPAEVEKAITPNTKAILCVNLLGNSCEMDKLQAICQKHNLIFLEDNCESMGATYQNRNCGTFGLMGTHSTFFSHHISTMEGGLIMTDDAELYDILKVLRAHGWLRNLPDKNHVCNKLGDSFQDAFRFALPGYCLRPTELQGACGLVQLKKLDSFIDLRRKNAAQFIERFGPASRFKDCFQTQTEYGESSWFGFSMILPKGSTMQRQAIVDTLVAHSIECRPIVTGDFTQNPAVDHCPHRIVGTLPNSKWLHDNGWFVGNNPVDLTPQFDRLEQALEKAFFKAQAVA